MQRGSHGSYVAAIQPSGGGAPSLVLMQPSSTSHGQAAKSIMDTQPQIKLPAAVHSLHALAAGAGPAGSVAVVLADGTVAGADFEHHKLRPLPPPPTTAAAAAGPGSSGARAGAAPAPGRPAAAGATPGCLAVAWQTGGAGAPAAVSFYRAIKTHPFLQLLCSCGLQAPEAGARLLGLHLVTSGFTVHWSGACVSTHVFEYLSGGKRPPTSATFSVAVLNSYLGIGSGGAAREQQQQETPAGRKRKAAAGEQGSGGSGSGGMLVCPLGESQLLLAAVAAAPGGARLRHVVVDGRYGCVLSSGDARLPVDPDAVASDASGPQLVPLQGAGGRLVLCTGGAVFTVVVEAPKADLAGLLGRLAVGGAGSKGPGGAPVAQLPRVGGGEAAAATAGARVTSTLQRLNMGSLFGGVKHGLEEEQQAEVVGAAAEGGPVLLVPAREADGSAPDVGSSDADGLVTAAQQLAALLDERQAAASGSAASGMQQLEACCRALLHQLHAQAQAQGHPSRVQQRRRRRTSLAAQQLLGRAAEAMAEAQLWALLREVLAAQPLQSLAHAPRLLPLAAAAHQHELIGELCRSVEDVPADALLGALQQLLGAEHAEARAAAGAAREQHRQRLLGVAEGVLEAAAAGAGGAWQHARLACARAAAAAVDGFTAREVCLHALAAADVDAVEVQAALQRLPPQQVLRLLRYLTKWVQKYGETPLEEAELEMAAAAAAAAAAQAAAAAAAADPGADAIPGPPSQRTRSTRAAVEAAVAATVQAAAALGPAPAVPVELRAPSWGQVLDWLRALLDAHLTKLAMMPAAAAPLQQLAGSVGGHAAATARLVPLRGVAEHMLLGRQLPTAAQAAASTYTVELLDLRVKT